MNTKRLHKVFLLAIIFLLIFPLQHANQAANAVTATQRYVATDGVDNPDCSNSSAPCLTLAYAVSQSTAGDAINIAAGVYSVNVTIAKSLTIQGAGMNATILDGGGSAKVLDLTTSPVAISDLTIKNGVSKDEYAGGIKSSGVNLTLTRVKITGNSGHFGGGVYFIDGTLNMTGCLVSDNSSTGSGGGIYLSGSGSSTITGTTVTGNEGLEAGALSVINTGGVTVTNSTITANSCTRTTSCAGAINFNNQPGTIINSTITGNLSINDAALLTNGGTVTFKNSIIAFNYKGTTIDDCRAPNVPFVSNDYNFRSDAECGTAAHDILQTSPTLALLGPLQDNGGLTPTVALLVGSPAIDTGTNTGSPATDQRGETRPYNGTCDIGAFEYQPLAGAFGKDQPADGATGLAADVTITWLASPGADEYQWCVDQTDNDACDSSWFTKATSLFEILPGMAPGEYFWTVRAKNGGGYTYSDGGAWWSFDVVFPPGAFSKTAPANGATNRPRNLTLRWNPSSNAVEYQYCLKKIGGTCTWKTTGTSTSVALTGLTSDKYQWQVRAKNANGTTSANGGTWWSFTVPPKPGAFAKTSPVTNAINKPTTLTLYWGASSNAVKYEYCIKKSLSATCTWKSTGLVRNVKLPGLIKNQKYYWQVRAKNAGGTTPANGGVWWNFKTKP